MMFRNTIENNLFKMFRKPLQNICSECLEKYQIIKGKQQNVVNVVKDLKYHFQYSWCFLVFLAASMKH